MNDSLSCFLQIKVDVFVKPEYSFCIHIYIKKSLFEQKSKPVRSLKVNADHRNRDFTNKLVTDHSPTFPKGDAFF